LPTDWGYTLEQKAGYRKKKAAQLFLEKILKRLAGISGP
jgi:hypothetical protein